MSKTYCIKKNGFFGKSERISALKDLNIKIDKGECIGIIGSNGSGKTTLLRIIAGTIAPTKGKVIAHGKNLSFLDFGSSLQDELTGRENIMYYGTLLGINAKTLIENEKKILEFAELLPYADVKLKKFSNGMKLRLIFSIAMVSDYDNYLIDEILAVGDADFQRRSINRIRILKSKKNTIIVVSHDFSLIKEICDKVIVLHKGKKIYFATPQDAIRKYVTNLILQECRQANENIEDKKRLLARLSNKKDAKNKADIALIKAEVLELARSCETRIELLLNTFYNEMNENGFSKKLKEYYPCLLLIKKIIHSADDIMEGWLGLEDYLKLLYMQIILLSKTEIREPYEEILYLIKKEMKSHNDTIRGKKLQEFIFFLKWLDIDIIDAEYIIKSVDFVKALMAEYKSLRRFRPDFAFFCKTYLFICDRAIEHLMPRKSIRSYEKRISELEKLKIRLADEIYQ